MKKLVAIALVLAMASMANAGVGFIAYNAAGTTPLAVVAGQVTVNVGDVITVKLIGDGACTGIVIDAIDDGAAAGVASNIGTLPGSNVISSGYLENTQSPGAGVSGALISYLAYSSDPAIAASNVLASFQYTVAGPATIAMLTEGTQFLSSDTFTYTVNNGQGATIGGQLQAPASLVLVPEPMTLGLLGLGGLFLRRRLA